MTTTAPAAAQGNFSISFGYFYDELAPYGRWYHHPRWGDVWHPIRVERGFRPYRNGHWEYTNRYGWLWESDYDEWGDITSHYGRWVYDPNDGWLWVPGYVWAPAWVVWRSAPGYVGWFPMPPDDRFLAGDEIYRTDWNNWDRGYGYADWYGPSYGSNWLASVAVWVDDRHFAETLSHSADAVEPGVAGKVISARERHRRWRRQSRTNPDLSSWRDPPRELVFVD